MDTPTQGPMLGIDVGGTKIAALVVDGAEASVVRLQAATDDRPLEAQVIDLARQAVSAAGGDCRPLAIGIGIPGQVDPAAGIVRLAVNLSVNNLPLADLVAAATGIPSFVEHDARAAAQWLCESSGAACRLAYLSVGTGISAGVVLDGVLVRGTGGLAGEIGHLVAAPDGPLCPCGLRGCLEAVASGPALAREAAAAVARSERTGLTADATAAEVYRAAAHGDALAMRLASEAGAHLARAIRGLVLAFGVERVVIGGGLSRAGAPFFAPIQEALADERERSQLIRAAVDPRIVELLPADAEAGTRGAVAVARAGLRRAVAQPLGQREVTGG